MCGGGEREDEDSLRKFVTSPERNTCHSLSVTSIHTGQYRTVQYGTVQYGTVQYGTVKTFLKEAAFILGLDIQGPMESDSYSCGRLGALRKVLL